MEVNFSVFFGLAVQLYESTLVADRTPFDAWMESGHFNPGFGPDELAGLNVFVNEGACIECHAGPELTKASIRAAQSGAAAIRAMNAAQGATLYDAGFYNIGITPTTDDLARGDRDPILGQPLAFSRQSLFQRLQFNPMGFPIFGDDTLPAVAEDSNQAVCDDTNGDGLCSADEAITPEFQRVAVDGAFKTPGLRNVELTGPYFHNGGVATLRQVVQFYNRGGNFCDFNSKDLDANIKPLDLTAKQERQLVAFMVSLTDPRVKYQTAPFDHPELRLPANGLDAYGQKRLPPVGSWGSFNGLKPFLNLDPQDAIFTPEGVCTITP
jgi:cytochrome c peroxidase